MPEIDQMRHNLTCNQMSCIDIVIYKLYKFVFLSYTIQHLHTAHMSSMQMHLHRNCSQQRGLWRLLSMGLIMVAHLKQNFLFGLLLDLYGLESLLVRNA